MQRTGGKRLQKSGKERQFESEAMHPLGVMNDLELTVPRCELQKMNR